MNSIRTVPLWPSSMNNKRNQYDTKIRNKPQECHGGTMSQYSTKTTGVKVTGTGRKSTSRRCDPAPQYEQDSGGPQDSEIQEQEELKARSIPAHYEQQE
jgi:hypothetical protein